MDLFVVIQRVLYEDSLVIGVFSDYDKAEEAATESYDGVWDIVIKKFTLDVCDTNWNNFDAKTVMRFREVAHVDG